MSCLLYPLSYIAMVVKVAFARYTQQQGCSAPVWCNPQPLTRNAGLDLGDDGRHSYRCGALIEIL